MSETQNSIRRFLNGYDFAHISRDVVNQLGKVTPDIIKNASLEIGNIAQ